MEATQTLGQAIDELHELREQKRELEEQIKVVEQEYRIREVMLLERMDKEGVTKSTGGRATATVSESTKPNVIDWDLYYEFIHRNKYYHLLERRPSVTGCREMFELKGKIPGVEPYTHRTVRILTVKPGA